MRFLLTGIIALLLSGCLSEPDCVATASNKVQFRFRDPTTNKLKKVLFSSIRISSGETNLEVALTATNNVTDSLLNVSLPVNSFLRETRYIFTYGALDANKANIVKKDSLTITYDVQNIIVSVDCGPYIYCSNLVVPSSSFVNEPKLLNNQLSTGETVNIELKL